MTYEPNEVLSVRMIYNVLSNVWSAKVNGETAFAGPTDGGTPTRFEICEVEIEGSQQITTKTYVDNIRISGLLLGDVDQDGNIDLLDVFPFVEILSENGFTLEADLNLDGAVDLNDVPFFVHAISN